jgi:hypothetical protein
MNKSHKIAQIYGYVVCLTAVITFLISLAGIIGAIFDLSDPLHARSYGYKGPSLVSFETYKVDVLKSTREESPGYVPDDETIRGMYEASKADRIQRVRHQSQRNLTVSSLLILICIILFTTHWIWLRRLGRKEG